MSESAFFPLKPPVLVVDDEYGPRESIAYTLGQNFEVDSVSRALDGLARIREKKYDVVVMDIRMPEMDGIRAVEELRKIDNHVSVIMLTGYGTLQTAQQAMLVGANQYLRKPPDVHELCEAVGKQAADARLRRTQAEAAASAVQLAAALKQEIAAAAPTVWLGRASAELVHDLHNPLTVVVGYADLLSVELKFARLGGSDLAKRILEYTDTIKGAADFCRFLAQNWRRAAGEVPRMELVNVISVLSETRLLFSDSGRFLQIQAPESVVIRGSKFELMRVFQNVIKNSLEAGAKKITIKVSIESNKSLFVVFEDDGAGMSEKQRRAIESGPVSFKTDGTGLGLGICRHIVSAHGGTFDLSSVLGVGTTVRITLPVAGT